MNDKQHNQDRNLTDTDLLDKLESIGKPLYVWQIQGGSRRWHVGKCMPIADAGFPSIRAAIRAAKD